MMAWNGWGRAAVSAAKAATLVAAAAAPLVAPAAAFADVTIGGTEIRGYRPSDMIQTDGGVSPDKLAQLPAKVQQLLVVFVRYILPFLAIAAVAIIVYNAIANLFRAEPGTGNANSMVKEKVPMRKVLKDIFISFFFVLFSWIIVELILYVLLGTQVFLETYLMS